MVETLVAITLFLSVISVVSGVFVRSLRSQRVTTALIAADNNAELAIEQMSREMRTGYGFSSANPQEISFTNSFGESVTYKQDGDFIERNDAQITAEDVVVKKMEFNLVAAPPAKITIFMQIGVPNAPEFNNPVINIQTTVSSRALD